MNKFVKDKILFNMERVNVIPSRTFSVILFFVIIYIIMDVFILSDR